MRILSSEMSPHHELRSVHGRTSRPAGAMAAPQTALVDPSMALGWCPGPLGFNRNLTHTLTIPTPQEVHMSNRTPVLDGNVTRWYDAGSLLHDLDDGRMNSQSRRSRLRMTRKGAWVISPRSSWEGEDPPDRIISAAEAYRWLSDRDPIYTPADLGPQGPAYAAYLAEQEI
jgi:hypothetical protein